MMRTCTISLLILVLGVPFASARAAETSADLGAPEKMPATASGYVIGAEDVLDVTYWRDPNLSAQVTVRPDGFITLPLLGDVQAAGMTPVALSGRVETLAGNYVQRPVVTVNVRQTNSLKAFITGEVARPGLYVLRGPTTVLQLIAMAGGLTDYADRKHIRVVKAGGGASGTITMDYTRLAKHGRLDNNVLLQSGDTVMVR